MENPEKMLTQIRPSARQLDWQRKEFTAFFHFGINTFTGREWGDGQDAPALFDPPSLDTDQWLSTIQRAGMKGCILTAKHHDGFCLWNTKTTAYSVMRSPFKRDVVGMLADSCRRYGLALGLYLSPWDRHEATYGQGEAYNDFFCAQLEELLTGYGPLFELWFDGACGEGKNGRVQRYDWQRIYNLIRLHQPGACIAVCGPDVRWCGNEAGQWRQSEWSAVPAALQDCEKIQEASQQSDDASFRERGIRSCDDDLGSRAVMAGAKDWVWYPAEVNTSIRPGWFYHAQEDSVVKPAALLTDMYEHTVGGNAVFLLNIPPSPQGRIHANDEEILLETGAILQSRYSRNLAKGAAVEADFEEVDHEASHALREDETYWKPEDGQTSAVLLLSFKSPQSISRIVLAEQIQEGQRIEMFTLTVIHQGVSKTVYEGTTVGYKKICAFDQTFADTVILGITRSRVAPTIRHIAAFA